MPSVEIISTSFIIFFSVKTVTELYLNWRNKQHILFNKDAVPQEFDDKITADDHLKAAKYTIEKINFEQLSIFYHFFITLGWLPFGGLNLLDKYVRSEFSSDITRGLVLFSLLFLISYLLSLPEKIYSIFVIEEKFGFNKMNSKMFIKDQIKQLVLSAILALPLLYVVLVVISKFSQLWWLYAWAIVIAFQFFILWAYPTFIAPLFNKFSPLDEGELKDKVNKLLDKTGFHSNGLFVMDASVRSSHGNAYFTGLGKKKRIVFFDTLLSSLAPNEVEAVLAHELGHFKKKHILKSLIRSLFISFGGFYLLGEAFHLEIFFKGHFVDLSSSYMALILFSIVVPVYTFLFTPISSWLSRKNEYEADTFASEYSEASALISSLIKLYKDNASTLTPDPLYSKFYHSHPPALLRIAHLKSLMTSE